MAPPPLADDGTSIPIFRLISDVSRVTGAETCTRNHVLLGLAAESISER